MEQNYKLTIAYDGTRFFGWERQPDKDTIQGKLEAVLGTLQGHPVNVIGAGRTDAGVHARAMTASVVLDVTETPDAIRDYLNRYLPDAIAVREVKEAAPRFHARYNALGKTYRYTCHTGPVKPVFDRKYVTLLDYDPDVEKMRQAAAYLLGENDFASFCGNPRMKKSTVRLVDHIAIERRKDRVVFTFHGTGFLQTSPRDRKAFAAGNNGSDSHAVLGDRSGLVGADHTGTAQCFHTVQPVHQCPVLHHAADCQSKGNGDGGRQPLRNGSNGNGNAGHEHVENRLAPQYTGKEHGSAYAKAQQSHDFSKSGKAFLKRCHFLPDLLQHGGDLSHLGACAGGNDHCFGTAPQNCRAGVDDVVLMQVVSGVGRVACLFGNCFGFAGENGLVHRQPCRLYQCTVRRNIVAGFQPHQVTADQFPCRNGLPLAVPTRRGGGSRQIAE